MLHIISKIKVICDILIRNQLQFKDFLFNTAVVFLINILIIREVLVYCMMLF